MFVGGNFIETFRIYLSGGMGKFGKENFEEGNKWREYCKKELENYECNYKVLVINPNDYFNFKDNPCRYKTQREIMEFDLMQTRNSNLIIVNFNDVFSLGTMAEITTAYNDKTHIIGLNEENDKLHPWQIEMCNRIFLNVDEMLEYIKDFYLR